MNKKSVRKRNEAERKNRLSLTMMFSCIVFAILLLSVGVTVFLLYLASWIGIMDLDPVGEVPQIEGILIFMSIVSVVIGFGIAVAAMKYPLRPISHIITQMNRLASGDFKARLEFSRLMSAYPPFRNVKESFNTMAQELESTEMLRKDFVNNFSHEFKTPIVSIAGFAKLIKRGNLTDEQKLEYIDIIEEESLRLAAMASNVLNLTKVENQSILTDVSVFNLSEQLRSCVLLLESKWTRKMIDFSLEFDEITIEANEELLKQVWINLIDNAVKFSPDEGMVEIRIEETGNEISVTVTNSGSTISEENKNKIFNKFYQCDESHSGEGNGVGLAIVKRVIDLHKGRISVISENDTTSFTVSLPK